MLEPGNNWLGFTNVVNKELDDRTAGLDPNDLFNNSSEWTDVSNRYKASGGFFPDRICTAPSEYAGLYAGDPIVDARCESWSTVMPASVISGLANTTLNTTTEQLSQADEITKKSVIMFENLYLGLPNTTVTSTNINEITPQ